MSDTHDLPIAPVPPVSGPAPVQPVRSARPLVSGYQPNVPTGHHVGASSGGQLPAAYAQFSVNPDTHDVVIQVRDALTDQVISEYPSREVEAMARYMRQYADTLARARAARVTGSAK